MLRHFLEPKTEAIYAFMRISLGLLFAFHGAQGLFGLWIPPEYVPKIWTQGWIGKVIELTTGLLMAGGLFTHWAAFIASGTMAVAYTQFHWKFAVDSNFFPIVNKGEMALIYAIVFLYIACRGGGKGSLDQMRAGPARWKRG
ncbi:MAG: DoxX family protein [Fibrobacterota bacterium]|nr:DoxX family protein [Fibrobacterota bacterium]